MSNIIFLSLLYHLLISMIIGESISNDKSIDPIEINDIHDDNAIFECDHLDFDDYIKCIDKYNQKLKKRETITMNDLGSCRGIYGNCVQKCGERYDCLGHCPICPNMHLDDGFKRVIVEGVNANYKYDVPIMSGQNITTIIKLTNLINNTNIIDMPTNVNSTNVNNIHVYNNRTETKISGGGEFGLGSSEKGSCCFVVQPKTCSPSTRGYRCHHKRHRTCGGQCTSRIIHAQSRKRCSSGNHRRCQQHISYVPQPHNPRCIYTNSWPFVQCGGGQYRQQCDGCYDHYGYGSQQYYGGGGAPSRCASCYDNGFQLNGQLYRRGPVLRPFNYHQPPCYLFGTCSMPMCTMYGCFGNEFMDPTYYGNSYENSGPYPRTYYDSPNSYDNNSGINVDVDHPTSETESNWAIEMHKCRVVSDDGKIVLKNCTESDLESNPYAGSPVTNDHPNPSGNRFTPDRSSYDYDPDYLNNELGDNNAIDNYDLDNDYIADQPMKQSNYDNSKLMYGKARNNYIVYNDNYENNNNYHSKFPHKRHISNNNDRISNRNHQPIIYEE